MPNHTHFTCEHELKFCKECDIPFCGKCGKEWGKEDKNKNIINSLGQYVPTIGFPHTERTSSNDIRNVPSIQPISINNELIRTVNIEKGEKPS